jgi:hypothetical protein
MQWLAQSAKRRSRAPARHEIGPEESANICFGSPCEGTRPGTSGFDLLVLRELRNLTRHRYGQL